MFTPKKLANATNQESLYSLESQSSSIYWYTSGHHWGAHSTPAPRVPQWDSAPVTHIYWVPSCCSLNCFLCLLMFPKITSRINLCLSQLLDEAKLRHYWTLLCRFIKTSAWPLDYGCISKISTYPFSKEGAKALRLFSQRSFSWPPYLK